MLKIGDIVQITSINKEGIILNIGIDLETNENKYCVETSECLVYFTKINDIIKIDTLEDRLKEISENNINYPAA